MRIACYGFADHEAGSVVGSNHVILKELLGRGHTVDFFNKPSFMPATALRREAGFRFVDCNNPRIEALDAAVRRGVGKTLATPAQRINHYTFARNVIRAMRREHARSAYDIVLFLGTAAFDRVDPYLPTVSWLQGPPGTDARSIVRRFDEVRRLSGLAQATTLAWYGRVRSGMRRVRDYRHSDFLIVGSNWAKRLLCDLASFEPEQVDTLPYPVDLDTFRMREGGSQADRPLELLWLGRIIPRKRLDLFLDGAAQAIERGLRLRVHVVGGIGFAPGYERLLRSFPYPESLEWRERVSREEAARLLRSVDVLAQPSEEENFGASVAEALACGTPTITGPTNGTGEYACSQSIVLDEYSPECFSDALFRMDRQRDGLNPETSRQKAEDCFSVSAIVDRLIRFMENAVASASASPVSGAGHSDPCVNHTAARPVRVLHLVNHLHNRGNGVVNAVVDLSIAQAEDGHEVAVAASGGDYESLLEGHGVQVFQLEQRSAAGAFRAGLELRRLLGRQKTDILHAHMMSGAVLGAAACLGKRCRLVTTVHNSWQKHAFLMRVGARVIAVSQAVADQLVARGTPARKVRTVPNGTLGSLRGQIPQETIPLQLSRPSVVTVAGVYERKGIFDLLACFESVRERVKGSILYYVGDGPERERLEAEIKRRDLEGAAVCLGFRPDVQQLLTQTDVFVLASHEEPFGLVLTEAREAGCAIVATRVGGIPSALDEGAAGVLVEAKSPAALADSIAGLLQDEGERARWSLAAQEGLAKFSVTRMAEETLAVYRECLG